MRKYFLVLTIGAALFVESAAAQDRTGVSTAPNLPELCAAGEVFITNTGAGKQCTSSNVWSDLAIGGGAGSGPVTLRVSSDQTSTSTSFADVSGLTTSVNTTTTYSFRCNLLWTSTATTEGGNFSINGPATSFLRWWRVVYTSATAHTSETQTSFDSGTLLTSGPGSGIWPVEVYGTFTTSASGTFAIRWRAETGGANTMTIKAGSFCQVY